MAITIREVEAIMDSAPDDLTPFLRTAERVVANTSCTESYNAATVDEITMYLAAHFACVVRPPKTKEKIGNSEDVLVQPAGSDLNSSRYGEIVRMLDTAGRLKAATGIRIKLKALA